LIFVGIDKGGSFNQYPYGYYDAALMGCADELRNQVSAKVDFATKNMTRSDAINKAKGDAKTYVVYLQLKNPLSSSPSTMDSGEQIEIEYIVFSPSTAKIAASGTSFQNSRRAGPLVVGPTGTGSTNVMFRQELLKRAGQEAAQRIIKSLHLNTPKTN
jgi:hypothetical protein